MSDEIKEILDRIKNYPEKLYCLNNKEKTSLLDYITNLQQELDTTNEKWQKDKQFYNCRLEENVKLRKEKEDYKSRCEKAIEYIKEQDMSYYGAVVETKMDIILTLLQGGKDE